MYLDDLHGEVQPQPKPIRIPAARRVHPVKPVEDLPLFLLWNGLASIPDLHHGRLSLAHQAAAHLSPLAIVLHRILKEILHCLRQEGLFALNGNAPLNLLHELQPGLLTEQFGIFRNSGQVCVAGSRLLVERSIHDDFVSRLTEFMGKMKVGDPLDPATNAGAVNSERQLMQNLGFVEEARTAGRGIIGGKRILKDTGGYFMEPTIVTGVTPEDRIAREEVFGPVLAVLPFDTEDEALSIANGTEYGLAAAVWTSNLSRAHRMVRGIRAGVVHVNTYGGSDNTVPLGGVKQSGNGHDKSLHALDKYLDLKTAWIKL